MRWIKLNFGRLIIFASVMLIAVILGLMLFQTSNVAILIVEFILLICMITALFWIQRQQNILKHRTTILGDVSKFNRSLTAQLPPEDIIKKLHDFVQNQLDFTLFYVGLIQPNSQSDLGLISYPLVRFNEQDFIWQSRPYNDDFLLKRGLDEGKIIIFKWKSSFSDDLQLSQSSNVCSIPLITMEKKVGGMIVVYEKNNLKNDHIKILEIVANEAALAIRSTTLYTRQSRLINNLTSINQTIQDVMFNLERNHAIRSATETVKEITGADGVALFLEDKEELHNNDLILAHSIGLNGDHIRLYDDRRYRPKLLTTKYVNIPDIEVLPIDDIYHQLAKIGKFQSLLQIPLKSGNTGMGVLCVFDKPFRQYHKTDLELLETFSYQVTSVIDYIDLLKAVEHYAMEQAHLVHLSRVTVASLEIDNVVKSALSIIQEMNSFDYVGVGLLDKDGLLLYEAEHSAQLLLDLNVYSDFDVMIKGNDPFMYVVDQAQAHKTVQEFALARNLAVLAGIPMVTNNETQGLILLGYEEAQKITPEARHLLETATNQISAQIFNAQQHTLTEAALNRRLEQLSLIENITLQISLSHDADQLIHHILKAAIRATQARAASLGLVINEYHLRVIHLELIDDTWETSETLEWQEQGVMGYAISLKWTVVIKDNKKHFAYLPPAAYKETYQSSLIAPLQSDAQIIGALHIESKKLDYFNHEHIQFINNLARHAVISIQNTQLWQQRENRIEMLTKLREFSFRISGYFDRNHVLKTSVMVTHEMFPAQWVAIYEVSGESGTLQPHTVMQKEDKNEIYNEIYYETSLPGQILKDVIESKAIQRSNLMPRGIGENQAYASLVAAPIIRDSQVSEILVIAFARHQPFERAQQETLELFLRQIAVQLENIHLYEQVRARRDQTQAILDSSRDGIILLDVKGNLLEANFSAEGILNLSLDQFIHQNFYNILVNLLEDEAAQDQSGSILADIEQAIGADQDSGRITNRSFQIRRGDRLQYIEESGTPVYDDKGAIIGRLLTLYDVTEKQMLDQFREEITSMVIHDLRGPLTSIITSIDLTTEILSETGEEEIKGLVPVLEVSNEGAAFLLQLVESLLDISRLEIRRLPMERAAVNIVTIISDAIRTMRFSLDSASIHVIQEFEPDLPNVYIDPDKIRRVIINLLDNALHFSPQNGKILIEAHHFNEQKILIRIADSGPGIPEDETMHIFDKFHQITKQKPEETHKGTGLGLTFCKLVIEAHDETIWVEQDSPLPGACFAFTAPIAIEISPPLSSPHSIKEEL